MRHQGFRYHPGAAFAVGKRREPGSAVGYTIMVADTGRKDGHGTETTTQGGHTLCAYLPQPAVYARHEPHTPASDGDSPRPRSS